MGQGVGRVSTQVGDWADGSAERFPPETPVEHAPRNPTAIMRTSSARDLTRMPVSMPSSDSTPDIAKSYSPDAYEHLPARISCRAARGRVCMRLLGAVRVYIRKDEAFTLNYLSDFDVDGVRKHWSVEAEGVKLAVLSARIHRLWKLVEK